MDPIEVTQTAIGDDPKGTAERLGKNVSWIYRMMSEPEHDAYTKFLQLYLAGPSKGKDLYYNDFSARHFANKHRDALKDQPWDEAVADAMREVAEGLCEAVKNKDPKQIEVQLVEGIRSLQLLLEIAQAKNGDIVSPPSKCNGRMKAVN